MDGEPFTIPVLCRLNAYAQYDNCLKTSGNEIAISDTEQKVLKFPNVYDVFAPETPQAVFYKQINNSVRIWDVVNGYSSTVIAYGQTGGGKTYTMMGNAANEELKGIIPRSLETVFGAINEASSQDSSLTFVVTASYLGIINEEVFDLLNRQGTSKALEVRASSSSEEWYVVGATEPHIHSPDEGLACIQFGKQQIAIANTLMSGTSNRMHILFYVTVHRRDHTTNSLKTGRITLADLGGTERDIIGTPKHTRSLSNLCTVVVTLAGKAGNTDRTDVPYRGSKLTRLLRDSLGGTTRTAFVACVRTDTRDYAQTLATLRYAARVGKIVNYVRSRETFMHSKEPDSAAVSKMPAVSTDSQHKQAESKDINGAKELDAKGGSPGRLPADVKVHEK